MEFLSQLFDTTDFPPRWNCGTWTAGHGWLHILSDLGVWSAYVAIPCVLGYFILRRRDLPFRKVFLLFGAFIFACGTTHLMEAIIFWWPAYRLAAVIKLFTAIFSWATVFALIPIVPKVLAMRSPEELAREVKARSKAEENLRNVNDELEVRIEQRTAELARSYVDLQMEREWFHTTLASIGDAVIATDLDSRITFLNPVAEKLTGWSDADATGRPLPEVFNIVNAATRQHVENPAHRALREGAVVGLANHTTLIARDGSMRMIDDSAAPIRAKGGKVVGCVLVFRDVSERRKAEEASAKLAAIVDSSDDAIISKTLDGIIVSWNAAAERLYGYSAVEAIGKSIELIVPPELHEEELSILHRLRHGERIAQLETVRVAKDGRRLHISLTVSPLRDKSGRIIGASKIARDITDRKRIEEALREADRRKNEFLAMLAHELRNPLAPIRNALQIVRQTQSKEPTIVSASDIMERQVLHMVRLVDDLLDVSRISRGLIDIRRRPAELASIIHQAVETCRPLIESHQHVLTITLPPDPVYLNADAVRLAQVFGNLLNNAAKYTAPGGKITLAATRHDGTLSVSVKDTGVGIPKEMLPQIFDMFTQGDQSFKRAHGGLGIGLTLVQRIVELHGGSVSAASDGPETGSEFVVRLPLDHVSPPHHAATSPPHQTTTTPPRKVLLVDDNRDAATSLALLLQQAGHKTRTVHDGQSAVPAAESFRPDVILLDIGLPGLNGYEVCRQIRQQSWGRAIRIIALTGWGQQEDRQRSKAAGFDEHLVKPVEHTALMQLLSDPLARDA